MSMKRWSIVATFVAILTITSLAILGSTLGLMLRSFQAYHAEEQQQFISWRLTYLFAELQNEGPESEEAEELDEVRQLIERENAAAVRHRVGIIVIGGEKRLMIAGVAPSTLDAPFPAPVPFDAEPVYRRWIHPDGRHFILTSVRVSSPRGERVIRIALDSTDDDRSFVAFRKQTFNMLAIAALLTALVSAFVAWLGLRPIARITATAKALDVAEPGAPLDRDDWPRELRPLAAAFSDMQIRIHESFERLSQFSDDLAHELRTPLNNLLGLTEVALGKERSVEEYQETLELLQEEHERLRKMIDELLFLSRAEHAADRLERREADLRREAEEVVELFLPSAEEKGITLDVDGEGSARVDRMLFRRALNNLLSNAIRFTPEGGRVDVVIATGKGGATVEVVDTGEGIAKEYLPKIFDRFVRVEKSRVGAAHGAGLGLAIVRSIMDLHGGSIDVTSGPGSTTFRLWLPNDDSAIGT